MKLLMYNNLSLRSRFDECDHQIGGADRQIHASTEKPTLFRSRKSHDFRYDVWVGCFPRVALCSFLPLAYRPPPRLRNELEREKICVFQLETQAYRLAGQRAHIRSALP